MNLFGSKKVSRTGVLSAVAVVLVLVALAVAIIPERRGEIARRVVERVQRSVPGAREAEEESAREQAARKEQQRIAAAQQEAAESAALAEAEAEIEAERQELQAAREQEARRRAARERQERERRIAEEQRLAAARAQEQEEEEERRRQAAELQAQREAEEREREESEAAEQPREEPVVDTPEQDDTPEVDTESSIDDVAAKRGWDLGGDLRPIVQYRDLDDREGETNDEDSVGFRARLRATWNVLDWLRIVGRVAGRCSTEDCDLEFVMDSSSDNGLDGGQFTIDELFVHSFRRQRFDVAVGRLQTRFVLRGGVFAKSLDRNDSNNTNVTWTDGLQATFRARGGWTNHLVLQHNASDGSGSIRRGLLDFDDSSARTTYFVAWENIRDWGPVVQRAFDISYLPQSLLKDGAEDGRREDYWGIVGRMMFRWPRASEGFRLRAGFEAGYTPETPTAEALNLAGDVDRFTWNVVVSLIDFTPAHSIGINYAHTGPAWYLSPQYRPNEKQLEIRHRWRPKKLPALETRIRWRKDIEQFTTASEKREVVDIYVRATWRFTIKGI